jgi:hypothetical protein
VRALAIEGPGVKVSRAPVGVAVLRRLGSSRIGVGDFEVEYIESTDDPATWEVSDGSNVDDNVLSPDGVSNAAAYSSALDKNGEVDIPFHPIHSIHPQQPLLAIFQSSFQTHQKVHEQYQVQVMPAPVPMPLEQLPLDPLSWVRTVLICLKVSLLGQ